MESLCRSVTRLSVTRLSVTCLSVAFITACTIPPLDTPTASPSPSPMGSPTPSVGATPASASPSPSQAATPDLGAVPSFDGGEIAATAIDGLRVRQRPGASSVVITGLLPLGSELGVLMGPIPFEDLGWYLVTDADPDEPQFSEGWVAAGFEPEPFLRATGETSDDSPVIASFALTGDAEYGPIEIDDEDHALRWAAVDPEGVRCRFAVLLAPASGEPIRAIQATIGDRLDPGTLQPTFFAAQPDIRGQVFVTIQSDCAWTLFVTRVPPPD